MTPHAWVDTRVTDLADPVLIVAFEGWNDAGRAATMLVEALSEELDATLVAEIDPEEFYDFQVNRPTLEGQGAASTLVWPANDVLVGRLPSGRDVLLCAGVEPNVRWRTFSETLLGLADRLGVEQVVALGALQVDVPHSRPTPVTARVTRDELHDELPVVESAYEGPTGIVGVLTMAFRDAGMDTSSLWAGIPHYLAGSEYPQGAVALADVLFRLLGVRISLSELTHRADSQHEQLAQLLSDDRELADYVAELERRADEREDLLRIERAAEHVDGETLAAELERFLRNRPEGGPGPDHPSGA